jgi:hypothetical protein
VHELCFVDKLLIANTVLIHCLCELFRITEANERMAYPHAPTEPITGPEGGRHERRICTCEGSCRGDEVSDPALRKPDHAAPDTAVHQLKFLLHV